MVKNIDVLSDWLSSGFEHKDFSEEEKLLYNETKKKFGGDNR